MEKKLLTLLLLPLLLLSTYRTASAQSSATTTQESYVKGAVALGYSHPSFLNVEGLVQVNRVLCMFTYAANTKGRVGRSYDRTIHRGEFTSDVREEGLRYSGVLTLSLGYQYNNLLSVGAGLDFGFVEWYQNRYDSSHILSNSGRYSIGEHRGTKVGYCTYIMLMTKPRDWGKFYLKVQASSLGLYGMTLGYFLPI